MKLMGAMENWLICMIHHLTLTENDPLQTVNWFFRASPIGYYSGVGGHT